MKQNHPPIMDAEQHATDATLCKLAAYFPKSSAERPAQRHADRPAEFHEFYVFTDDLPVLLA
jgi:hypothetical protein